MKTIKILHAILSKILVRLNTQKAFSHDVKLLTWTLNNYQTKIDEDSNLCSIKILQGIVKIFCCKLKNIYSHRFVLVKAPIGMEQTSLAFSKSSDIKTVK